MRTYAIARKGITPTVGSDLLTIIAPANKAIRIKRVRASGEATASTAMRTLIQRSTGGSGSIPLTPEKTSTTDPAAGSTIVQAWITTQPTPSGNPLYSEGWNAFGGGFDLTLDGREIYLVNAEQLSIRADLGTGLMDLDVEFEEL